MIHPENKFKQLWNGLILIFTVFFSIEVPLRITMGYQLEGWLLVVDYVITICFCIDVVLNFLTADYAGGQLVTSHKQIAINYLKGWFIIDLLAAVPFDLFLVGPLATLSDTARVFRLVRLARMARIAQFMRRLARSDIMNISVLRMIFMTFWVLMLAHWAACIWIELGGGNIAPEDFAVPIRKYLRSLYWATTTITTIGYGDITPLSNSVTQTIYTMCLQLVGAGMFGYVIGNIASLIANLDVARGQYLEKLEKIGTFMKFKKIPLQMQSDIRNYYTYMWDTRHGYDESQVLADLPRPLLEKVSMYLLQETMEKVPIFKGASSDLIRQIVTALKPEVYTPGDYVFRKGDLGNIMYFIGKGEVQVVADDGTTVYATLREGNFFGEIALLMSMPRTASIRAVDFCDLYSLDKDTFAGIVENYPDFSRQVIEMAEQRAKEIVKPAERPTVENGSSNQKPRPSRVEGFQANSDGSGVALSWTAQDHAAVYQVIRRDSGKWKILHGFVQSTHIRDEKPLAGVNIYRVRAANQAGPGDWSDSAEIVI